MTARHWVFAAAVSVLAVLGLTACSGSGSGTTASAATPTDTASANPTSAPALQQAYSRVVGQVLPSVVEITTDHDLGSGVIFDKQGDVVTNDHVVGSATHFTVRLASNATPFKATLVGAYPPDDLAVIRLDSPPSSVRPARFGDSAKVTVGTIVLAMGNPLGLTGTVTNGIVSANGRLVNEPKGGGSPGATLPNTIQTSAAINPGNSGGALVDLSGDVIGIPTLAAVDKQVGQGSAAPGIGFAIASNTVTDIAKQLIAQGHVTNSHRADLGVRVTTVVGANGSPAGVGVVSATPGGPAAGAGITSGDVITALNGTPVASVTALSDVLAKLDPGKQVSLDVTTPNGAKNTVHLTLGQLPGS